MSDNILPSGFQVIKCGIDRADECLAMRGEILAELADNGLSRLYLVDETDEEFRNFFVDENSIVLGIVHCGGELAGCAISSFREAPLKIFESVLPAEACFALHAVCYIELIQVKSKYRGNRFQRFFLEEMENALLSWNPRYLTAIVSPDNKYSLSNFLELGYYEVGRFIHEQTGYLRIKIAKKLY